jgi:arsenite methyltransferase
MDIKETVKAGYGKLARNADTAVSTPSAAIGYDAAEVAAVPEGTPSFGCGNPTAIAGLAPGETVLDLGSGAGFDCFLAAQAVGPSGHVIGVDMTPDMIARARENATRGGYGNVEFRFGELEELPLEAASVDVVISNCVINLVPDKARAFAEAFRALRPGGRLHVSDLVLNRELPVELADDPAALVGCVGGAARREDYLAALRSAGFTDVSVDSEHDATAWLNEYGNGADEVDDEEESEGCCCDGGCCGAGFSLPEGLVASLTITARKPGA